MKTDLIGQKVKLCYSEAKGKTRSTTGQIRAVVFDGIRIVLGVELLDMAKGKFIERCLVDVEIAPEPEPNF